MMGHELQELGFHAAVVGHKEPIQYLWLLDTFRLPVIPFNSTLITIDVNAKNRRNPTDE